MIRIATLSLALAALSAATAAAQTYENLAIGVEGRVVTTRGGEQPSASASSQALAIDRMTTIAIAQSPDACGFSIGHGRQIEAHAVNAWVVDVTPTKVDGDAVTFHLRWARVRDDGKDSSTAPRGDMTVTLRPGEFLPIDTVPVTAAMPLLYGSCQIRAMSIRVAVSPWPWPDQDRRLVATDLWLIERLPNGTERSQLLSVRGLFNQPTPFFFDTVNDGAAALDFFGEFTISPGGGSIAMKLKTRSRLTQNGTSSLSMRATGMPGNLFGARQVESTIRLDADGVVAVELPRLSENDAGAFANRAFSIRVRSRRIR